ncbi:MAG: hypothetical protein JO165_13290, partial [Candidatus Eremiobacteraeota bacterium]|nr:hypothetical protein [Candidatus Eremiobacteraeota bacterium]
AFALLRSLQRQGPPQVEVQRAKALLLAQRVLPLDSYDGVAGDILSDAKYELTKRDNDRFWAALVTTTPRQIQDALRRNIAPERFVKVEVAPE